VHPTSFEIGINELDEVVVVPGELDGSIIAYTSTA